MNTALVRIIKAVIGVAVLIVLLSVVTRWWGDYKEGRATQVETTKTAEVARESKEDTRAASVKAGMSLQVLTDGLNFRRNSSREADVIRGLNKGEKLRVLGSKPGWYQVQDAKKKKGWISSSPSYTKVVN